jgi:hypothetical protein
MTYPTNQQYPAPRPTAASATERRHVVRRVFKAVRRAHGDAAYLSARMFEPPRS